MAGIHSVHYEWDTPRREAEYARADIARLRERAEQDMADTLALIEKRPHLTDGLMGLPEGKIAKHLSYAEMFHSRIMGDDFCKGDDHYSLQDFAGLCREWLETDGALP